MSTPILSLVDTAQKKLGEAIAWHVSQRGRGLRECANNCGVSVATVEEWFAGTKIPTSEQWGRLKGLVNAVGSLGELRMRAIAEVDKAAAPKTGPVTNLGAKIAVAISPTVPRPLSGVAPAADDGAAIAARERRTSADAIRALPSGWKSHKSNRERQDFARGIFETRPAIPIGGDDGIRQLLIARFGVGLAHETLVEIRAEVLARQGKAIPPRRGEPPALPVPAHAARTADEELSAAVDLVLAAVPNLVSFTIAVTPDGEATVAYKVREEVLVKTTEEREEVLVKTTEERAGALTRRRT